MSLNTTPRTWVVGEIVTAAELNTEVRDAFSGLQAAWTNYSCSWTAATTNPTLGNGTLYSAYFRVGKTVCVAILCNPGNTTTIGSGAYLWSLPFTQLGGLTAPRVSAAQMLGTSRWAGHAVSSPGANNLGCFFNPSTTDVRLTNQMDGTTPEAFNAGDALRIGAHWYEAA